MGETGGLGGGPGGWLSRRGRGPDVTLCLLCMGDPWISVHPLSPFAHLTRTLNGRPPPAWRDGYSAPRRETGSSGSAIAAGAQVSLGSAAERHPAEREGGRLRQTAGRRAARWKASGGRLG